MPTISSNNLFFPMLINKLAENWNNNLSDNFSIARFGQPEREIVNSARSLSEISKYADQLSKMYNLLGDSRSRDLMLQVLAFRILGHRKVRLPLSQPSYWQMLETLKQIPNYSEKISVIFPPSTRERYLTDLSKLNINVKFYGTPGTILHLFLLKHYEYTTDENTVIGAKANDVVIECGACWGETTLLFADQVGVNGKVYSFEFIPENLKIYYKNLNLNPRLAPTIKTIEQPLWDKSNAKMYYKDRGPGSIVKFDKFEGYDKEIYSISIDDIVRRENIHRVDFIKMDIEGAEPYALQGAVQTLKTFKPQLAISIYHNMSDFSNIIHQINNLQLGYKFYLGHCSI